MAKLKIQIGGNPKYTFVLLAVVLFICGDYFGVCCQALEISAVEMFAFT